MLLVHILVTSYIMACYEAYDKLDIISEALSSYFRPLNSEKFTSVLL